MFSALSGQLTQKKQLTQIKIGQLPQDPGYLTQVFGQLTLYFWTTHPHFWTTHPIILSHYKTKYHVILIQWALISINIRILIKICSATFEITAI